MKEQRIKERATH